MTNPSMPRIAIVGGGFTGAVFAVHLARAADRPLLIEIIEPRSAVGAGLAYGSCEPEHRVNVPSDFLNVFEENRGDFTRWLKANGVWSADGFGLTPQGYHFSRRRDFGAYIASLVADARAENPSSSTIRHCKASATGLQECRDGWLVTLDDGEERRYEHVVLCATYGAPSFPWPIRTEAAGLPGLVKNPWDWDAIKAIPRDATVVTIGTGLTMCDVVGTLRANGHQGTIHAVSRRALTPRPHGLFRTGFDLFAGQTMPDSALELVRLMRRRIRDADALGLGWHAAIDSLRLHLKWYWRTVPPRERAKIVRRLRPYWDVHRFRIAPQIADMIERGRQDGWLTISSGGVRHVDSENGRFAIGLVSNGQPRTLIADAIVNCTGPDGNIERTRNAVLRHAFERGYIRGDDLRIGLDVDEHGRLIGRSGTPHEGLWAAGPLARSVVGEATGVPEASHHARHVAEVLAKSLSRAAV